MKSSEKPLIRQKCSIFLFFKKHYSDVTQKKILQYELLQLKFLITILTQIKNKMYLSLRDAVMQLI
jgi:hypothetical protein